MARILGILSTSVDGVTRQIVRRPQPNRTAFRLPAPRRALVAFAGIVREDRSCSCAIPRLPARDRRHPAEEPRRETRVLCRRASAGARKPASGEPARAVGGSRPDEAGQLRKPLPGDNSPCLADRNCQETGGAATLLHDFESAGDPDGVAPQGGT
jgi:hypothetical protein